MHTTTTRPEAATGRRRARRQGPGRRQAWGTGLVGLACLSGLEGTGSTAWADPLVAAPASVQSAAQQACRPGGAGPGPVRTARADAIAPDAPGEQRVPPGPASPVTVLQRPGLTVQWQGDFLLAYTGGEQPDDAVALRQPDYGRVRAVWPDRAQGLLAVGDQASYRVTVGLQGTRARFDPLQVLPALTAAPCSWLSRAVGRCQAARPFYSPELKALLIEGHDGRGPVQLRALGLPPDGRDRPLVPDDGARWRYGAEVPGTGGVLLRSERGARAYFDGERLHVCPP